MEPFLPNPYHRTAHPPQEGLEGLSVDRQGIRRHEEDWGVAKGHLGFWLSNFVRVEGLGFRANIMRKPKIYDEPLTNPEASTTEDPKPTMVTQIKFLKKGPATPGKAMPCSGMTSGCEPNLCFKDAWGFWV